MKKHKELKQLKWWQHLISFSLMIAIVIAVFSMLSSCVKSCSKPTETVRSDGNYTEQTAYNMCVVMVKSQANYPAEAEVDIDEVFYKGKTTYVQGTAKFMNGFGAKIPKEFECRLPQGKPPSVTIGTQRGF